MKDGKINRPTLFPFPIFDYNKSSSSKGITSKKRALLVSEKGLVRSSELK